MLSVVFGVLLRPLPFPIPDLGPTHVLHHGGARLDALTELRRALERPVSTRPSALLDNLGETDVTFLN